MGVWGPGILDNDEASDIYSSYVRNFESGVPLKQIKDDLRDLLYTDQGPELEDNTAAWLGYAQAQIQTNTVENETVDLIRQIKEQGIDNDFWKEDIDLLEQRKAVIRGLYEELLQKKQ